MHQDLAEVLLDEETIAERVGMLADALATRLDEVATRDEPIVMIPVLTGSLVFTADLIRRLPHKLRLDVVTVSSYPGTATSTTGASIHSPLPDDLDGRHVVVVDDIFDTGRTMELLDTELRAAGASGVTSVVLLAKPARHEVDLRPDLVGFEIPDAFVVGYGLDYDGLYRNLPCIGTLRSELIKSPAELAAIGRRSAARPRSRSFPNRWPRRCWTP